MLWSVSDERSASCDSSAELKNCPEAIDNCEGRVTPCLLVSTFMPADVTNDEVVFSGSDYMGILNTYYTEVLGAAADATTPLVYDTGGISAVAGTYTYDSATAGVGRSASFVSFGSSRSTISQDWNSNGGASPASADEDHLPTGSATLA